MKHLLTIVLAFTVLACTAQTKKDTSSFFNTITVINRYSYLSIMGKVVMTPKNSWLVIIQDTSKLCIKYQDSIFILHVNPKYVKKINDSTFTFPNK